MAHLAMDLVTAWVVENELPAIPDAEMHPRYMKKGASEYRGAHFKTINSLLKAKKRSNRPTTQSKLNATGRQWAEKKMEFMEATHNADLQWMRDQHRNAVLELLDEQDNELQSLADRSRDEVGGLMLDLAAMMEDQRNAIINQWGQATIRQP